MRNNAPIIWFQPESNNMSSGPAETYTGAPTSYCLLLRWMAAYCIWFSSSSSRLYPHYRVCAKRKGWAYLAGYGCYLNPGPCCRRLYHLFPPIILVFWRYHSIVGLNHRLPSIVLVTKKQSALVFFRGHGQGTWGGRSSLFITAL